jgi:hypothetical protein
MTPTVNGAIQVRVVYACVAKDRCGTGLAWEQRHAVIDESVAIVLRLRRRRIR